MMGTVLAEWAKGLPEKDLALKPERMAAAPAYMKIMPRLFQSYFRWRDNRAARRDGTELPPHAD